MKKVYLSIVNRLREKVPGIQTIDLFFGQYRNPEKEHPIETPAVFIEFPSLPFLTTGNNTSSAKATIKIHIAITSMEDTGSTPLPFDNSSGLSFLDTIDQIHKALQGFAPDNSSRLQGGELIQDTDNDATIVFVRDYICEIYDYSTANDVDYTAIKNSEGTDVVLKPQPHIIN